MDYFIVDARSVPINKVIKNITKTVKSLSKEKEPNAHVLLDSAAFLNGKHLDAPVWMECYASTKNLMSILGFPYKKAKLDHYFIVSAEDVFLPDSEVYIKETLAFANFVDDNVIFSVVNQPEKLSEDREAHVPLSDGAFAVSSPRMSDTLCMNGSIFAKLANEFIDSDLRLSKLSKKLVKVDSFSKNPYSIWTTKPKLSRKQRK